MSPKHNKLTPGLNLLWESSRMMLPEHKEEIIQMQKSTTQKSRPLLDEQRLQELSLVINEAYQCNSLVVIKIYDPFEELIIEGKVAKVMSEQKKLKLSGHSPISLSDIIDISII